MKTHSHCLIFKLVSQHLTTTITIMHNHLRQIHVKANYNGFQIYKFMKYNVI